MCYTIIRKREGKPNKPEREKKMEFYEMERFEMMGDLLEDLADWQAFEEDLLTNPWDN